MPLQTNPLRDKQFLKKLDLVKNKKSFAEILAYIRQGEVGILLF